MPRKMATNPTANWLRHSMNNPVWSKEIPKSEGWYFCKEGSAVAFFEITRFHLKHPEKLNSEGVMWAGPIPEPVDPPVTTDPPVLDNTP